MSRRASLTCALVVLAAASPASAGNALALVDASALPDDPAVLAAWSDAIGQERYAGVWTPEWKQPVAREAVAGVLSRSLATLRGAAKRASSLELLLAIGLTARFAHNVDVDGAADAGIEALKEAASRAPGDPRPEWFLGTNLCLMGSPEAMAHLQVARTRAGARPLPAAFWREFLPCAGAAGMPAHAVLAGRELERLDEATPLDRDLVARAKALLLDTDPAREFSFREAWTWEDTEVAGLRRYESRACGYALRAGADWKFSRVKDGICQATGPLGSFPGKQGAVLPFVLVVARRAAKGESLDDFVASFPFLEKRAEADGLPCPSSACRKFEVREPASYVPEGGGLGFAVAFERSEPEIRGLALETPSQPAAEPGGKVSYFTLAPRQVRYSGTLYYLVALDSTRSIADPAKQAYREFLESFVVE